jgi:2',3'-cyclic-nucleotide 2'-phosphodiesterase (5'-nucleotidase family)
LFVNVRFCFTGENGGTKPERITLLQINDCHGYLDLHQEWFPGPDGKPEFRPAGGYARIATLVKQIQEETEGRVVFCDNRDTFHGTRPVTLSPLVVFRWIADFVR